MGCESEEIHGDSKKLCRKLDSATGYNAVSSVPPCMQLNEMVPNWLQHGSTLKIFRLSCCKACTSGQEQVRRQQASDLDNVVSKPSRTFLLGFEPFCAELEKTEEVVKPVPNRDSLLFGYEQHVPRKGVASASSTKHRRNIRPMQSANSPPQRDRFTGIRKIVQ